MRVVKPGKLSVLCRTFERDRRPHLVVTVLIGSSFDRPRELISEVDLWTTCAEELAPDGGMIDEANLKVRGELVVTGRCFVPQGKAASTSFVRVTLGPVDKTLAVIGDRVWKRGVPTEPEPFTEMPVDWAHAFGGDGFARNPKGKGFVQRESDGDRPLPNIESPKHLIKSPGDVPEPAGFASYDLSWPQRFSKVGTYDETWLENRAFEWAEDMDPTLFNVAPEDQWLEGWYRGDESFTVVNMHPTRPHLEGALPDAIVRAFITKKADEEGFLEVAMRLDTVHLFPHRELAVLLYRGVIEIDEDDAADVATLLVGCEDRMRPRDIAHYREAFAARQDEDRGTLLLMRDEDLMPPAELGWVPRVAKTEVDGFVAKDDAFLENMQRALERKWSEGREKLVAQGLDPKDFGLDAPPPSVMPPTIDYDDPQALIEHFQERERELEEGLREAEETQASMEEDLKATFANEGLDYDQAVARAKKDASGPPKYSARKQLEWLEDMLRIARDGNAPVTELEDMAADPAFRETLEEHERAFKELYRQGAHFQEPFEPIGREASGLYRNELELAYLNHIALEERDMSGADLSGMSLRGIVLDRAFLEAADLTDSDLGGASLAGSVLAHATLRRTKLDGANLRGANLGGALIEDADLSGAILHEAVLARTRLRRTSLRGATIEKSLLLETVFEDGLDLSELVASQLFLNKASLRGARLVGAKFTKAAFIEVDLEGANLDGADLSRAMLLDCKLDGATFRGAELSGTGFVQGTTLRGAVLEGANMRQACLRGCDLTGARLDGACLDAADLSECMLENASMSEVRARSALFIRSNLTRTNLEASDLLGAILQKAKLFATNLRAANLFQADLAKVRVDGDTILDGANLKRARVHPKARNA
jgi:uncharacterized protein YjbI with pentapeptide repeats